jgi:hypothetical protein
MSLLCVTGAVVTDEIGASTLDWTMEGEDGFASTDSTAMADGVVLAGTSAAAAGVGPETQEHTCTPRTQHLQPCLNPAQQLQSRHSGNQNSDA